MFSYLTPSKARSVSLELIPQKDCVGNVGLRYQVLLAISSTSATLLGIEGFSGSTLCAAEAWLWKETTEGTAHDMVAVPGPLACSELSAWKPASHAYYCDDWPLVFTKWEKRWLPSSPGNRCPPAEPLVQAQGCTRGMLMLMLMRGAWGATFHPVSSPGDPISEGHRDWPGARAWKFFINEKFSYENFSYEIFSASIFGKFFKNKSKVQIFAFSSFPFVFL